MLAGLLGLSLLPLSALVCEPGVARSAKRSYALGRHAALATTRPSPEAIERALPAASDASCTARLRDTLGAGEDLLVGQARSACQESQRRVTRRLMRTAGRPTFGVVEQRQDTPEGVKLVVSAAERCRRWPLRSGGRAVLQIVDTQNLGCRLRRLEGTLPVSGVTASGERHAALLVVPVDFGRVNLEFIELDRALRQRGHEGLDGFASLELGEGAWAGEIDLARARDSLTAAHLQWVQQGRGVPALFVARHPEHPSVVEVRALANEADLHRQQRDYEAVVEGRITPLKFLERHPSSSFELEVQARVELGGSRSGPDPRFVPGPSSQVRVTKPIASEDAATSKPSKPSRPAPKSAPKSAPEASSASEPPR